MRHVLRSLVPEPSSSSVTISAPRNPLRLWSIAILLGAGAVLRIAAARGDLWLHALWSLSFARYALVPLDLWTTLHHDNNHVLNTLSLFVTTKVFGAHRSPIIYRLVPLLSGFASLPLLFCVRRAERPA